jgi:hypothetical protein
MSPKTCFIGPGSAQDSRSRPAPMARSSSILREADIGVLRHMGADGRQHTADAFVPGGAPTLAGSVDSNAFRRERNASSAMHNQNNGNCHARTCVPGFAWAHPKQRNTGALALSRSSLGTSRRLVRLILGSMVSRRTFHDEREAFLFWRGSMGPDPLTLINRSRGHPRMRGTRCLLHPRAARDKGGPYHSAT